MLEISNERIYGLEESIVASGYPMLSKSYTNGEFEDKSTDINSIIFFDGGSETDLTWADKRIKTAKNLGNTPLGEGHSNYLKGIVVQFDVRYPVYWTPQFQRYNFADIVSSMSSMHRITKMNLDESFNEYVLAQVKDEIISLINIYNVALSQGIKKIWKKTLIDKKYNRTSRIYFSIEKQKKILEEIDEEKLMFGEKDEEISIEDLYMHIISSCPQGIEKTMRVSTNYLQLKTIYLQRKNHKLKDWKVFCDWCLTLPYFKELCLGDK